MSSAGAEVIAADVGQGREHRDLLHHDRVEVDLLRGAGDARPAARCRPGRSIETALSSWPGAPLASITTSSRTRRARSRTSAASTPAVDDPRGAQRAARSSRVPGRSMTVRSIVGERAQSGEHERADRARADQDDPVPVADAGPPRRVQTHGHRLGEPGGVEREPVGDCDEGALRAPRPARPCRRRVQSERVVATADVGPTLAAPVARRRRRRRHRRPRGRRPVPTAGCLAHDLTDELVPEDHRAHCDR